MTLGRLLIKIGADNKELRRTLDDTVDRLENATDAVGRLGTRLSLGLTLPLAGASLGLFNIASDAAESEDLMSRAFGDMTDEAVAWSEGLSDALGLNAYALRAQAGQFDLFLGALGLTNEASYELSTALTSLAGDITSLYNLGEGEATQKLLSGLAGETEAVRRWGVDLGEATVQAKAYEIGVAEMGSELSQQQKVMARAAIIFDSLETAQGNLAETADSPANKWRLTKERAAELAIELGMSLMPAFQAVLVGMGWIVDKTEVLVEWFQGLSKEGRDTFVSIAVAAALLGPTIKMVVGLTNAINTLRIAMVILAASNIGTMWTALFANIAMGVGGLTGAIAAAQLAGTAFIATLGAIWAALWPVALAAAAVGAALYGIKKWQEKKTGQELSLFGGVGSAVGDIFGGMEQAGASDMKATAERLAEEMRQSVQNAMAGMEGEWGEVMNLDKPKTQLELMTEEAQLLASALETLPKFGEDWIRANQRAISLRTEALQLSRQQANVLGKEAQGYRDIVEALKEVSAVGNLRQLASPNLSVVGEAGNVGQVSVELMNMDEFRSRAAAAAESMYQYQLASDTGFAAQERTNEQLREFGYELGIAWQQVKQQFTRPGDTAEAAMQQVSDASLSVAQSFTPLGLVALLLGGILEGLEPALKALEYPIRLVGILLGEALAPVLEALFPVVKFIAIAFTYAAEVLFTIGGWLFKAIGAVVGGIGKAVKWLTFGVVRQLEDAGKAMSRMGDGLLKSADSMDEARDTLNDLSFQDAMDAATGGLEKLTEAVLNTVEGFKIQRARFAAANPEDVVRPYTPSARPPSSNEIQGSPAQTTRVISGSVSIPITITTSGDGRETYRQFYEELDMKTRGGNAAARELFLALPTP